VFGLKALVAQSNCSHPNVLVLDTSHDWPVYVSPGVLLLLYYTVTSLLKLRTHQPLDQVRPGPVASDGLLPLRTSLGVGAELRPGLCRGRRRPGATRSRRWS